MSSWSPLSSCGKDASTRMYRKRCLFGSAAEKMENWAFLFVISEQKQIPLLLAIVAKLIWGHSSIASSALATKMIFSLVLQNVLSRRLKVLRSEFVTQNERITAGTPLVRSSSVLSFAWTCCTILSGETVFSMSTCCPYPRHPLKNFSGPWVLTRLQRCFRIRSSSKSLGSSLTSGRSSSMLSSLHWKIFGVARLLIQSLYWTLRKL